MTQNQAAKAMRELVGAKRFSLQISHYYQPQKTRFNVYTNYEMKCDVGSGNSWQEAIDDLKKVLGGKS